jgi:hypothetical protein
MPSPPIGVANSVSFNFDYDPLDSIAYARQSNFNIIQIYLNEALISEQSILDKILTAEKDFEAVYYHAEGYLSNDFLESEYHEKLFEFLACAKDPKYIIHFDETASIDKLVKVVEKLYSKGPRIYVENYFREEGLEAANRNLKKFIALFTLVRNFGSDIFPVLDIPRLFHQKTGLSTEESIEWCFQLLNFFGNRNIPILLHLIDAETTDQARHSFTELGSGYLPYTKIFDFITKTRPDLEGIILEYEEKINPLKSRDYLNGVFG